MSKGTFQRFNEENDKEVRESTHKERRYKTMSWNPDADHCDADYDNHANQLNPNNDEYDHCREGNDD